MGPEKNVGPEQNVGSEKNVGPTKKFGSQKSLGPTKYLGPKKSWVKINHGTAAAYNGTAAAYNGTAAAYVGTAAAYGVTILIIMPLLRPNPFGFFPQGGVRQYNVMLSKTADIIPFNIKQLMITKLLTN